MPGKLTKVELCREVARVCESSLKESHKLLEIVLDALVGALNRGDVASLGRPPSQESRIFCNGSILGALSGGSTQRPYNPYLNHQSSN